MASAVDISADIERFRSMGLLNILLKDRSTGNNILWASNVFEDKGESYAPADEILASDVTGVNEGLIRTRASKAKEAQAALTKAHAEVFTPTWVVSKMVSAADKAWWEAHVGATWQDYVRSPRLEITCGEAPFLVNRYDAADGTPIDVAKRIGVLDRKLKFVAKIATTQIGWARLAHVALQSTYGYEFQGDNLLIARVNVLATLEDFARSAGYSITPSTYKKFARTISWNLWQMDGLSDMPPQFAPEVEPEEMEIPKDEMLPGFAELFGIEPEEEVLQPTETQLSFDGARIYDWKGKCELWFSTLKGEGAPMKFDYVIGNPPYQEDQNGRTLPVYDSFMDEAYKVCDVVELVHPGRFLFNAGQTHKPWNKKMLNDVHFKVLSYYSDAKTVFPGIELMGGVAITLHDNTRQFDPIKVFVPFDELRSVMYKVLHRDDFISIDTIVYTNSRYNLSGIYDDNPEYRKYIKHDGKDSQIDTNVFGRMPIFVENDPHDSSYIRIFGRYASKRVYWWVKRKYISDPGNLDKYKVFVPAANGASGMLKEGTAARLISVPALGEPGTGSTQSFLAIGDFDTFEESDALLKYIRSKFARALLGTLKITQHNGPDKWHNIPMQDFSSQSDIDWSKSAGEIDQQLYKKYGLTDDEIAFIESHVAYLKETI